jgi:ubiquinone biosynthesis monooxygenase Coq7
MTYNGIPIPEFDPGRFGPGLCDDFRSDHAGETGAVAIYEGMLRFCRDEELKVFALTHLETERRHLQVLDAWLPVAYRSRLLLLWYFSGWLLGVVAVLGGKRFAFITISAVERFVVDHYSKQLLHAPPQLRSLLENLMEDEAHHQHEAETKAQGATEGSLAKIWSGLIWHGSALAVRLARLV